MSTRVQLPAAPAPRPRSLFRLVPVWVLGAVVFIISPKTRSPHSCRRHLPPRRLAPCSPHLPREPARPRFLQATHSLFPPSLVSGPGNSAPFPGSPSSWRRGPDSPPPRSGNPAGDPQTLCFRKNLHYMRARNICRLLENKKNPSPGASVPFANPPPPRAPAHQRTPERERLWAGLTDPLSLRVGTVVSFGIFYFYLLQMLRGDFKAKAVSTCVHWILGDEDKTDR